VNSKKSISYLKKVRHKIYLQSRSTIYLHLHIIIAAKPIFDFGNQFFTLSNLLKIFKKKNKLKKLCNLNGHLKITHFKLPEKTFAWRNSFEIY
jgi:hypothetical protein